MMPIMLTIGLARLRASIIPPANGLSGAFFGRLASRRRRHPQRCPSSDGPTVVKVALFRGGDEMRMRTAEDDDVPRPLQMVGPRPLLWHVMRYYAHCGHKEFILRPGYRAAKVKDFNLSYREMLGWDPLEYEEWPA
jgi:hypothetical protein